MGGSADGPVGVRIRVWDLPTRLVHWSVAALAPFSWWSANSDHLPWHRLSGYAILALLIFRLIWGVAGSHAARFASFLRGPAAILAHPRGRAGAVVGHNPLGGWSVMAMFVARTAWRPARWPDSSTSTPRAPSPIFTT